MTKLTQEVVLRDALADVIKRKVRHEVYGVVMQGIDDVPIQSLLGELGGPAHVFVSLVGFDEAQAQALQGWARGAGWVDESFGVGAAHAVAVRNRNDIPIGVIKLVFVEHEDRRTHSLTRRGYVEVGPDDAIEEVCEKGGEQAPNEPQKNLWRSLAAPSLRPYLSLSNLLSYYVGVFSADEDTNDTPRRLLPELGLLYDQQLLTGKLTSTDAIKKRLEDNARIVEQLQQADEQDREKAAQRVSASTSGDKDELRRAYRAFLRIARNDRGALADLDLSSAKGLLTKHSPKAPAPVPPTDDPAEQEGDDEVGPTERPQEYGSLADAALALVAGGEQDVLAQLLQQARQHLTDNDDTDSLTEGRVVVQFAPDPHLLELVRRLTGADAYGGRLDTSEYTLGVVLEALGRHLEHFDVFDGVRLLKLQDLLQRTRDIILQSFEGRELLDRYLEARKALLPYLDLLVSSPLTCLLAQPEALDAARGAILAYERLLDHIGDNYPILRKRSRDGAQRICRDILGLDVIVIVGTDERAALISPVSPLVLWKYVEMANLILEQHDAGASNSQELRDIVRDIPEPLLTIYLPGERADEKQEFGFSHHLESLPIYRPVSVESSDLGEHTLRVAAAKLAILYPPARDALRIVLVDPYSTENVSRAVDKLVHKDGFGRVSVVIARTQGAAQAGIAPQDEMLDKLVTEGVMTIEEAPGTDLDRLKEYLRRHPAHLLGFAGERRREVDLIEREETRLHPISLPRRLQADPLMGTVSLQPRSIQPAKDGPHHPFGFYQTLVSQLDGKAHAEYSLHESAPRSLEHWHEFLPYAQFLLVAGDVPRHMADDGPLRLTQDIELYGDTVFTQYTSRIRDGIDTLLRRLNYQPSAEGLNKLLANLQALGGDGLFATISDKGTQGFLYTALRGQLGLAVALDWYREQTATERHVALSLDSHPARQWLQRRDDEKRTDLLGLRQMADGTLAIDIIEVKAYEATDDDEVIESHPGQQLRSVARVIYDILHRQGNILIDCRRELLRRLIYREGLLPNPPGEIEWVDTLNDAIDGNREDITINLVLVELAFEKNIQLSERDFAPTGDVIHPVDELAVKRVRLGEPDIQRHLRGVVQRIQTSPPMSEIPEVTPLDDGDVARPGDDTGEAGEVTGPARRDDGSADVTDGLATDEEAEQSLGFEPTLEERADMEKTAREIYRVLRDIGIRMVGEVDASIADVGPSIVRYKVKLQTDVRTNALQSRTRDLMRELALEKEPIIDVLPGTPYMYIDLPRRVRRPVRLVPYLEHLIEGERPEGPGLLCPLGVTPDGHVEWLDITLPPHMLVAGSTGSGKTMFLYSLIVGLTYLYTPADMQLVLIDPKQTDFVFFNDLPHLRGGAVITDAQEAVDGLMLLLKIELEKRTNTLKEAKCRDIRTYNARHPEDAIAPLVVIIDEFADLADVMDRKSREDFDLALKRLAQRARNVGIHLIIATQRPTTDIVNGNLKSNLPCRISFRLASQVDSRTILDAAGAEHLLGNGDMLYSFNGRMLRLQGFFVPDEDITDILNLEVD